MKEEKKYWLKKEGEGDFSYKDQDGVSWGSPKQWLWIGFLGGCGCGSSDDFAEEAFKLLEHYNTPHEARTLEIYEDRFYELMAHWFDTVGLTDHGRSVSSAWLSDKGKQIYNCIISLV
jgi:hypothetical protein